MKKWKSGLICLGCILVLTACGGGDSSGSPAASSPAASSPAQRIAALEVSGSIPRLDRTNSIAGPDADNNGVRDDVDAYISTRYLAAPQKAAALQVARTIQKELLVSKTDKPAIKLLTLAEDRAVNCVYSNFDRNGPIKPAAVVQDIESVTTNTQERLLAYLAFSKAADGTTGTIPEGETCE